MFALRNWLSIIVAAVLIGSFSNSVAAGECSYYGCGPYGYAPRPNAEPIIYPEPPRYLVDQGPNYTGPNITDFCPRPYDPGYVNTFAYPYVGRYAGWRYRARPAMRFGYVSPSRGHHRIPSQFDWPLHR